MLARARIPRAIALLLVVAAGASLLGGLPTASGASTTDCLDYVETPLWITDVSFELTGFASEESTVTGSTPFVTFGDQVMIEFVVENRVPGDCKEVYDAEKAQGTAVPTGTVEVYRGAWNVTEAGSTWVGNGIEADAGNVCEDMDQIGANCTVRDFLFLDEEDVEDFVDEDGGEVPINYVAGDNPQASNWRPLAGLERVLVVEQRPDLLGLHTRALGDDPFVTSYGTGEEVTAEIAVENAGTYPDWDPNGGTYFWGRSSYDSAASDDIAPDQRNTSNPTADPLDPYEPTDPELPPCWKQGEPATDATENDGKWNSAPPSYATTQTTESLTCSYKRGTSLPMPLSYEISRNDTDQVHESGVIASDEHQPGPDDMSQDKDDAVPPDTLPAPVEGSATTAVWDQDRHLAYLFGGTSTDRLVTYDPYAEDGDAVAYRSTLPFDGLGQAGAAWDHANGTIYLAGTPESEHVLRYDPANDTLDEVWNMKLPAACYDGGDPCEDGDDPSPCAPGHDGTRIGSNVIWQHQSSGGNDDYWLWVLGGRCPGTNSATDQTVRINLNEPGYPITHSDQDGVSNIQSVDRSHAAKAWDETSDTAYLIGGLDTSGSIANSVVKVDLSSDGGASTSTIDGSNGGFDQLALANASAVWNESADAAYVLGGEFEPTLETLSDDVKICREASGSLLGSGFYLDTDASNDVSVGDIRLRSVSFFDQGSVVGTDDGDKDTSLSCEDPWFAYIGDESKPAVGDRLYIGYHGTSGVDNVDLEADSGSPENWWIRLTNTEEHEAGTLVTNPEDGEETAKVHSVCNSRVGFGFYDFDHSGSWDAPDWGYISTGCIQDGNDPYPFHDGGNGPFAWSVHVTSQERPFGSHVTNDTLYTNDRVYEFDPGSESVSLLEYENDNGDDVPVRLTVDDEELEDHQDRTAAAAVFDADPPEVDTGDTDDDGDPIKKQLDQRVYVFGGHNETQGRRDVLSFHPGLAKGNADSYDFGSIEVDWPVQVREQPLPKHPYFVEQSLFDTSYAAGTYNLTVDVGHDGTDWVDTGEPSYENNTATGGVHVHGLNLTVENPIVEPLDDGDGIPCGLTKDDPCPAGTELHVQGMFRNAGDELLDDPEYDDTVRDRSWKAGLFLNGQKVDRAEDGRLVTQSFSDVPTFENSKDGIKLWEPPITVGTDGTGGVHTLEIRLDHPDLYPDDPAPNVAEFGRVAETIEQQDCPGEDENASNVYCATFFYEDETPPEIGETSVDPDHAPDDDELTLVREGEEVTVSAEIDEESPETVQANVTLPNGTTQTHNMTREDPGSDTWTLTQTFVGQLGNHTVDLRAVDVYGREDVLEDAATIRVEALPVETTVHELLLNGNDTTSGDANASYQGTASEPENWIRLEATFEDTGREDPWNPDNRTLNVTSPNGEHRKLPMGVYTVCTLWNTVSEEEEGTAEGEDCEEDEQAPHIEVQDERPRFYVDTRCDGEDHAGPAGDCQDVDAQTREAWKNATLGWIGAFHANVTVQDAFNRTHEEPHELELTNPYGPPTVEDAELSQYTLEPGEATTARANASDNLTVENVTLEVTKPDGTVDELGMDLDPDRTEDAETKNGTYEGTFLAGADGALDQAGTYEATIVVENFAGDHVQADLASVEVVDEQPPTIDRFDSVPGNVQEVGGPLTWEAEVTDATQVQPPELTVHRPASGPTERTLTFNETRSVYELDPALETTAADLGTWTYELLVQDHAGNAVTANGTVDVVENRAPQVVDWTPDARDDEGTAWGPPTPVVQADLVDFSHGVNASTIEMTIDGEPIEPVLEPIDHGYRLTHALDDANLTHGDALNVTVTAADHTEPDPLVAEEIEHSFRVDASQPEFSFDADPMETASGERHVGLISQATVVARDEGSGPGNVDVTVQRQGTNAQTTLSDDGAVEWSFSDLPPALQEHGAYTLTVDAADAVGNHASSTVPVFLDTQAPTVSVLPLPGQPPEVVSARIEDDSSLQTPHVHYEVDGEPQEPLALEQDADGRWTARIPVDDIGSNVTYWIEAADRFENHASSPEIAFEAGHVPPEIEILEPGDGDRLEGTTRIGWQVEAPDADPEAVRVSFQYEARDGFAAVPGLQHLPAEGAREVDTSPLPNGPLVLKAIVDDGVATAEDTVEVYVNNPSPAIGVLGFADAGTEDGMRVLDRASAETITVEFEAPVASAWANLTQDGEVLASAPLSQTDEAGLWSGTLETPDEEGTYGLVVTGVEEDGTRHVSQMQEVQVDAGEDDLLGVSAAWMVLTLLTLSCTAVATFGLKRRWK